MLACSKCSDSGERCEVKKAMKSRGELGREVREPSLTSPPPSLLFFRDPFYFAPLPTIWTSRTGYRNALTEIAWEPSKHWGHSELVPISPFQSPSLFSFVETTNSPQDPAMLTVVVLKMGFELVSNHEFGSVDNKEQNVGLVAFLLVDKTQLHALCSLNLQELKRCWQTNDRHVWLW